MAGWGQPYNLPLWMTETSGYSDSKYSGAMSLAKVMYTALRFGNVSAWVFWSLSEEAVSDYSLLGSGGAKSNVYGSTVEYHWFLKLHLPKIRSGQRLLGLVNESWWPWLDFFRHIFPDSIL